MGRTIYKDVFSDISMVTKYDDSIFKINLQLFAGDDSDKTEEPTQRKLSKARDEGNIALSKDLLMAVTFIAMAALLQIVGGPIFEEIIKIFYDYFDLHTEIITENFLLYSLRIHFSLYLKLMLFFGFSVIIAISFGLLQSKFLLASKALKPDLNKLNPIQGFKKIFSLNSLIELIKSLIKIFIVGYIGFQIIYGRMDEILGLASSEPNYSASYIAETIITALYQIGLALIIIGVADYFYQRLSYRKKMKMTKQEVKEEMKDVEGNPEVKQKRMQLMSRLIYSRMMQQVPSANVVVTNPTHYAVAIKYDGDNMRAPIVVAKGADEIARKIKDIAFKNGIPILQKPSLARELYSRVEINEEVPEDMYRAVAEVLAYIYKIGSKAV